MPDKLYRIAEIAKILQVCTLTVSKKMKSKQLPCTEIAGVMYMTERQLDRLINSGEKRKFERVV